MRDFHTGTFAAMFAMVTLILFFTKPHTQFYSLLGLPISRVYSNVGVSPPSRPDSSILTAILDLDGYNSLSRRIERAGADSCRWHRDSNSKQHQPNVVEPPLTCVTSTFFRTPWASRQWDRTRFSCTSSKKSTLNGTTVQTSHNPAV